MIGDGAPIQDRLQFAELRLHPRQGRPAEAAYRAAAAALVARLRPAGAVVFLDLEATGIDVTTERIVEITIVRIEPDGAVALLDTLVDPGRPIPVESTRIHGIGDGDVRGAPTLAELAPSILRIFRGAALAGYNHGWYDLPLLEAELERSGQRIDITAHLLVDACTIFKRMERRDLSAAVRFYCGDELEGAHSAGADVLATIRVLEGQLARYPDLPRDLDALDELTRPRRRDVARRAPPATETVVEEPVEAEGSA